MNRSGQFASASLSGTNQADMIVCPSASCPCACVPGCVKARCETGPEQIDWSSCSIFGSFNVGIGLCIPGNRLQLSFDAPPAEIIYVGPALLTFPPDFEHPHFDAIP